MGDQRIIIGKVVWEPGRPCEGCLPKGEIVIIESDGVYTAYTRLGQSELQEYHGYLIRPGTVDIYGVVDEVDEDSGN